jgi:NTP pyrophosphatase (non-canonical NTP hydrolase)
VLFATYDKQAAQTDALDSAGGGALLPMLGVAGNVGALLSAYKHYLRGGLDLQASRELTKRELGDLLWYITALARQYGIPLEDIARHNLVHVSSFHEARGGDPLPQPVGRRAISLATYQDLASQTDISAEHGDEPEALRIPLLGLVGEAGSLLNAQKKLYQDDAPLIKDRSFVRQELGDLLWYLTSVASHVELSLDDIASANLYRARSYYDLVTQPLDLTTLPTLDAGYPKGERLPRQLLIQFKQHRSRTGPPRATMKLLEVYPNAYPNGPVPIVVDEEDKTAGYTVGSLLGNSLTDNSPANDAYRFHDAIHFGLMAVLGWSPNLRNLLGLKRRSAPDADRDQDGARAILTEEGIAAILKKRSVLRAGFATEESVDTQTLEIVATITEDLEVGALPPHVWRRAIAAGFSCMAELEQNRGGFVVADLDRRTLSYSRTRPSLPRPMRRTRVARSRR